MIAPCRRNTRCVSCAGDLMTPIRWGEAGSARRVCTMSSLHPRAMFFITASQLVHAPSCGANWHYQRIRRWPSAATASKALTTVERGNGRCRLRDVARLHSFDARLVHPPPRGRKRAVRVDGAARILDHADREPQPTRIERTPGDAEIRRQAADIKPVDAALAEIAAKTRGSRAVGLDESRIAVDIAMPSLSHHQLGVVDRDTVMEARAFRPLHAVIGPQDLLAV